MDRDYNPHNIIIGLLLVILVFLILMAVAFVILVILPLLQLSTRVTGVIDQIQIALKDVQGGSQQIKVISDTLTTVLPQFKAAFCQFIPTLPFCTS